MARIITGLKTSILITLITGLILSASAFTVVLINKWSSASAPHDAPASGVGPAAPGGRAPAAHAGAVSSAALQHSAADRTGSSDSLSGGIPGPGNPHPDVIRLKVPLESQYPQLPAGCEATSLSMLLGYYGIAKDKMALAREMPKDPTPIQYSASGQIAAWGDPETGFVGDMTGQSIGYGAYHLPVYKLMKQYIPTAVDETGEPFQKLIDQLALGIPSIVWTTKNYEAPQQWIVWNSPNGKVKATFQEHVVVLTGSAGGTLYVNDPLSGAVEHVSRTAFQASWEAMGSQALSYSESK